MNTHSVSYLRVTSSIHMKQYNKRSSDVDTVIAQSSDVISAQASAFYCHTAALIRR